MGAYNKTWPIRKCDPLLRKNIVGCLGAGEDDYMLSKHVEMNNWPIGSTPGLILQPRMRFGGLMGIADDG